tara:strand:+ start:189 stop:485 length:297 start_codon:yes stop_codon:yes gene_type:complete
MIKKIKKIPSFIKDNHMFQEGWEYIDDPTYSRSIGSHVCMTCSKFDYTSQANFGTILCCNCHQKLISNGYHLTHSCELYQKKENFGINKKLSHISQAA